MFVAQPRDPSFGPAGFAPLRHARASTIIFFGLLTLVASTAAIITYVTTVLKYDVETRAAILVERNIGIAQHMLADLGGRYRIDHGLLIDGDTPLDGDFGPRRPDPVADRRRRDDLSRRPAGGHQPAGAGWEPVHGHVLEAEKVRDQVLDHHGRFRGTVAVGGEDYTAAYDPILDDAGQVAGILFVGISHAKILAGIAQVRGVLVTGSAIALCLASAVFWVIGRRIAGQIGLREQALAEANGRLDTALENMGQGLCSFDGDGRLIMASRRFAEMYGLTPAQVPPGTPLARVVELRYDAGCGARIPLERYVAWRRDVAQSAAAVDTTVELMDGRVIAIHHQPMPGGGWVATHDDITQRRLIEDEARFMARHDALTRLGNRVLFHECLERARVQGELCAVVCLDLDRFKEVNDTLGHPIGDLLLQSVAGRLVQVVRSSDTVVRLGGDEFAIICVPCDDPADTIAMAARLIETVSQPYLLAGQQAVIGTSIGIAFAGAPGDDPDTLLRNADIALYRAKVDARGGWRIYNDEMGDALRATRQLESDLRHALANDEFQIFYQPLVDVPSGLVTGFEALLRWPHAIRGMVPPADFIELAESSGLIVPLGSWVLRRALADAARWPDHLRVAVNLSTLQIGPHLVQTVRGALEGSGLAASRLELEITETALLKNSDTVMAILHELRGAGIKIVLDDFGTGFSSLSYLLKFPFEKIKIDKSFVHDVTEGAESSAIVRAVCTLAHSIGIEILAEGVETEAQFAWLREEGFDEVQGYLFSVARPAHDVPAMLAALGIAPAKAASSRRAIGA